MFELIWHKRSKTKSCTQPLPDTEEEKYLCLMATGNPYARNKLIEHNLRLVARIVKKFENTGGDSEETGTAQSNNNRRCAVLQSSAM